MRLARAGCRFGMVIAVAALAACGGGTQATAPSPGGGEPVVGSGAAPTPPGSPACTPTTPASLPTTTFFYTGGFPLNLVYDSVHQLIWVTNPWLNEVDAVSAEDGTVRARIPVPQPAGLDIAPDGSTVIVGTLVQYFYLIDPGQLRVVRQVAFPAQQGSFNLPLAPVLPLYTSNGKALIFGETPNLINGDLGESNIIEWDPSSNSFQDRTGDAVLPGLVARSADYTTIAIGNSLEPSGMAVYHAGTDSFQISSNVPGDFVTDLAVNPDGSQIAIELDGTLYLLDGNLAITNTADSPFGGLTNMGLTYGSMVYSSDGLHLFAEDRKDAQSNPPRRMAAFNVRTQGVDAEVSLGHDGAPIVIGPQGKVLTVGAGGVGMVDPSAPTAPDTHDLQLTMPALSPGNGAVEELGLNPQSSPPISVFLGAAPACVSGTAVAVPSGLPAGPVNLTAVSADHWAAIAANAYSRTPTLNEVEPTAGPSTGGTAVSLFGYGLDYPPSEISVTVGGAPALVSASGYAGDPYQSGADTVQVAIPPGTPGWADVTITTPGGTASLPHGFLYTADSVIPGPSTMSQILLDSRRQKLFMTGTAEIEVFSLATQTFLPPILLPGASAGAQLDGLAMTPDGAQLLVTDPTDRFIAMLNPDDPADIRTLKLPYVPLYIGATSDGHAFFTNNLNTTAELDLATLTVVNRTDMPGYGFNYQTMVAATPDGSTVYVGNDLWHASTDSFTPVPMPPMDVQGLAISADASRLAAVGDVPQFFTADGNAGVQAGLPEYAAGLQTVPGAEFDPTGALFFLPAHNAIDIVDTNNGRRLERIPLPDPLPATPPLDGFAMAFDPSGPALYVLTQAGLSVIHLPALPLSLGSVQPASGSAAGGDMVRILGTGFEPGTSVSLNGSPVATTVDSTTELHIVTPTLPAGSVAITVSTPEGQHYTWADAFAVH